MHMFKFRLQKVLDYRETMEHWAQEAYLDTRVARLEAEAAMHDVGTRRKEMLHQQANTLYERQDMEQRLARLDDEEVEKKTVVEVLKAEEEKALQVWHEKKRELETMVKLRDKAKEEWTLEANRKEQAELDEWAVLKRGA
jgi:flagellar export protein FliJ